MRADELTLRVLAPLAVVTLLGAGALWGPWSPLVFDSANARFAGGDVAGAVREYEAVARGWTSPARRAEAWRRSAALRRSQDDIRGAVAALEHAVDVEPDAARRADTLVELATLYRGQLAEPRACAEAFEQAAAELASARLELAAAACWQEAGDRTRAASALQRASADPAVRDDAERGLAALEGVAGVVADGAE